MNLRSLLAVPLCCALWSCDAGVGNLHTYWGPDGTLDGLTALTQGQGLAVRGLVTRTLLPQDDPLQFLEVVLVEAETPVTCSMYGAWLEEVEGLQAYAVEVFAQPVDDRPEAWESYLCQELAGAALDIFGGDGSYRALHALMNSTGSGPDGDLFRPASPGGSTSDYLGGNLAASQAGRYVGRLYERGKHANGVLPSSADTSFEATDISPLEGCAGVIARLVQDLDEGKTVYPDRNSLALQAATHRWYHHPDERTRVQLNEGGELSVGITFPDWKKAATIGGHASVTVFQSVARAPEDFPFEYVLLTSKGSQIELEACTRLSDFTALVWPEVEQLQAVPIDGGEDADPVAP